MFILYLAWPLILFIECFFLHQPMSITSGNKADPTYIMPSQGLSSVKLKTKKW